MHRTLILMAVAWVANVTGATAAITVNCDRGESLNHALAKVDRATALFPITVVVRGTCTEYVQIRDFDALTLKGGAGATLQQPITPPTSLSVGAVLSIESSRSVTVDGFLVRAEAPAGISIRAGSTDIRLRNLTLEGGGFAIVVAEHSQASIARVTAREQGWAGLGIWDASDVHMEDCLFEGTTGSYRAGLTVGKRSVLTLHGTIVRNMQVGITVDSGALLDVADYDTYYPFGGPSDVLVENLDGTNYNGLWIDGGSVTANARLRILNPGQPWGGDSSGVTVANGGTLQGGAYLEVSGSQGQGVVVTNNSQVNLAGSKITDSQHNGLVVLNNSTVAIRPGTPLTAISGNNTGGIGATDLFCDSRSLVTGGAGIAGATSVQCGNLLANVSEAVPGW